MSRGTNLCLDTVSLIPKYFSSAFFSRQAIHILCKVAEEQWARVLYSCTSITFKTFFFFSLNSSVQFSALEFWTNSIEMWYCNFKLERTRSLWICYLLKMHIITMTLKAASQSYTGIVTIATDKVMRRKSVFPNCEHLFKHNNNTLTLNLRPHAG